MIASIEIKMADPGQCGTIHFIQISFNCSIYYFHNCAALNHNVSKIVSPRTKFQIGEKIFAYRSQKDTKIRRLLHKHCFLRLHITNCHLNLLTYSRLRNSFLCVIGVTMVLAIEL